ncbi:MAG TPA: hypothetical protein VID27_15900, partial [Blastocatellia bacterium]
MQSNSSDNDHRRPPGNGAPLGTLQNVHASRDGLFTEEDTLFDDADAPASESTLQSERRRRCKRKIAVPLLVLFAAALALTIWVMFGGGDQKRINLRVGEPRTREGESQAARSPDDLMAEAIAEARRAAGSGAAPAPPPTSSPEGPVTHIPPTAPVTSPNDGAI